MKPKNGLFAIAFVAAVAVLAPRTANPAQGAEASAATPISITSCTPTFNANVAGAVYEVENNLTATAGDCIDVTATDITILVKGASLTGTSTGSGISIPNLITGVKQSVISNAA